MGLLKCPGFFGMSWQIICAAVKDYLMISFLCEPLLSLQLSQEVSTS